MRAGRTALENLPAKQSSWERGLGREPGLKNHLANLARLVGRAEETETLLNVNLADPRSKSGMQDQAGVGTEAT